MLVVDIAQSLATGMYVTALSERDDLLGDRPDFLGLGLGRRDPLVAKEIGDEVSIQRLAVRGIAAKMAACLSVSHGAFLLTS